MAQTLASISALLISVALLILGHGLQSTLLPLAAEKAAFSELEIGAISSAYFVGMVLGCLASPFVVMRAGHIRAYAALVSLMSAAAILHPVAVTPIAWILIRTVSGFCLAGFYMVVESWLNESATNENRGTVMSVYVVVLFAAMMVGQVSVAGMDITSFVPFVVASVAVSLAVIPVALTSANQPAPITLVRFRPLKLFKTSPAAVVGCFMIGIANAALWSLAPLYGAQIGLTTNQAAIYSAAIILGGTLAQWPIGRLSDRMDRRRVLIVLALATAAMAMVIIAWGPVDALIATGLAVVIGAFSQPAYAIAVSHGFDSADPEDFVETSSGLLLAFGMGSAVGPIAASILMEVMGPSGLFVQVFVIELIMAAFIVTRLFAREAIAEEEKLDFEYASTAQVGSVISPDPLDVEDRYVIPPEEFPAYEDAAYSAESEDITEEVIDYDASQEEAEPDEDTPADDKPSSAPT